VRGKKLAAIGVKVSRWITMHGVAVNVNSDLSFFERIIPCGISDRGVTSVENILSRQVDLGEFSEHFVRSFTKVFCFNPVPIGLEALHAAIESHLKEKELCVH
jgi:lipoyl(octanoyl) transferase